MNPAPHDDVLKVWGPLAITFLILVLFGWAFYRNPYDEGLLETVKATFVLAVGYWIGSSTGSKRKELPETSVNVKPPATVTVRKASKARRSRLAEQGDLLSGP